MEQMRIAVGQISQLSDEILAFARQLGVSGMQLNTPALPGAHRWEYADLRALRERCEGAGLRLEAIENVHLDFYDKVMLGLPGRDEQLDHYCATIRNMGRAGIPILGYHFMPNSVWRTSRTTPGRGGAHVTSFDLALVDCPPHIYLCAWSAMVAADGIVVPLQAEDYGAQGVAAIQGSIDHVRAGDTRVFTDFDVPDEAIGCGFHEAVRGVLSHHLVIKDKKIANYHPYPPTPWNGSPRDSFGTPGPYEDAVQDMPIFEENGPDNFKGVDIMRAVRSFDPCLPCGVHMYVGGGQTITKVHSPMFGAAHG